MTGENVESRQDAGGTVLKAPFPWFGGKSRVAHLVWERFGDVPNYVEPFAGSLAVLLGRPHVPRTETVNDKDCYLANFWRALQADPEGVAEWADGPVNEADLHARHRWLVDQADFVERMKSDPAYYDVQIAGWWVWGISCWIGSGWCDVSKAHWQTRPALTGGNGQGVNNEGIWHRFAFGDPGRGVHRKRPEVRPGGRGVSRLDHGVSEKRPILHKGGPGVHRREYEARSCAGRREALTAYMRALADRLRMVRVCCGDWQRVLGPSPTYHIGLTGILLDPPYAHSSGRDPEIYGEDHAELSAAVRDWAVTNGTHPKLRIALCGYEGEHDMPADWECVSWMAQGGYGARTDGNGKKNRSRERIWFSPGCLVGGGQGELWTE